MAAGLCEWGLPDLAAVDPAHLYLRPLGRLTGRAASVALAAGQAVSTGRSGEAAALLEILVRRAPGGAAVSLVAAGDALGWIGRHGGTPAGERLALLAGRLARPRAAWAGLSLTRPLVMGVVNVTPDSFSDGGRFFDPAAAIAHGRALLEAGADLVDIGGESTRPGAAPVPPDEEADRVVPVVRALAEVGAVVSIDTRRPAIMAAALAAGARIVNDVAALQAPGAVDLVARARASVVLMHMQGDPRTMQAAPDYACAPLDVYDFLAARIAACTASGIDPDAILVDPGIGFGKTQAHNLAILARLGLYRTTGCGVLLGVSRKSFIGRLSGGREPADRLAGSLAAALAGIAAGADLVRVHDVAETVQALQVATALESTGELA
jgi:dihydropteroate synthase